ncbi:MAG: hypothetical protein H0T88_08585, partial [Lysobacter sp.]|nr:hypothetical protein [Lysobacter sp.]
MKKKKPAAFGGFFLRGSSSEKRFCARIASILLACSMNPKKPRHHGISMRVLAQSPKKTFSWTLRRAISRPAILRTNDDYLVSSETFLFRLRNIAYAPPGHARRVNPPA